MLRVLATALAAACVLSPVSLAQDLDGSSALVTDPVDTSAGDVAALDDESDAVGRELLARKRVRKHKRAGFRKKHGGKKRGRGGKRRRGGKKGRKGKRGKKGGKKKFGKKKFGGHGGFVVTKGPVHRSSISCSARATSTSFSASKSVHLNAAAKAFKAACAGKGTKVDFVGIWKRGAAKAVAKAITSASATCTGSGNAYGCAQAKSAAAAWASATFSAHAKAAAQAINYCKCEKTAAFAAAFASGAAQSFKGKIVADVASDASADVCVKSVNGGFATASVNAISKCIEKKYAYIMAEATARALISGGCKYHAAAQADIKALVSGQVVSKKKC